MKQSLEEMLAMRARKDILAIAEQLVALAKQHIGDGKPVSPGDIAALNAVRQHLANQPIHQETEK